MPITESEAHLLHGPRAVRPVPSPFEKAPAMPAKRASAKPPAASAAGSSSPALNVVILGSAAAYGLWLLVARGRMSWPPTDLAANIYTVAGCLALVGPFILLRRDGGESGVGDTVWLTAGVLLWVFNLAALVRGAGRLATVATPISPELMGLIILAVGVAAWRSRSGGGRSWAWTNVAGWGLGLFWVGLALAAFAPGNPVRVAMR